MTSFHTVPETEDRFGLFSDDSPGYAIVATRELYNYVIDEIIDKITEHSSRDYRETLAYGVFERFSREMVQRIGVEPGLDVRQLYELFKDAGFREKFSEYVHELEDDEEQWNLDEEWNRVLKDGATLFRRIGEWTYSEIDDAYEYTPSRNEKVEDDVSRRPHHF